MINSIRKIFPNNKKKEIIGAVISVAYSDGTFDQTALLPDAPTDFNTNLAGELLSHGTNALLTCAFELPSAIKKLEALL